MRMMLLVVMVVMMLLVVVMVMMMMTMMMLDRLAETRAIVIANQAKATLKRFTMLYL